MRRQKRRSRLVVTAAATVVLVALPVSASWSDLALPEPGGAFAVGRTELVLTDASRLETTTPSPSDRRDVPLVVWYPATAGTGRVADYVDADLHAALRASGELSALQVSALRWVRPHAREAAQVSDADRVYPVLLLSPGNATNVEFYSVIAEALASRGYVVVGMNHPYQVTAARLSDGSVAVYRAPASPPGSDGAETETRARIDQRVADVRFVLDELSDLDAVGDLDADRLDLDRLGILGHSNGGVAAVSACREDARLDACVNMDGQLAGGPFGASATDRAPAQPFLFLTKEIGLHPELGARFEEAGDGAFRVVVPAARHEQFADGPLLTPSLLPVPRTSERVSAAVKGVVAAFFDTTLRGAPETVLGDVDTSTDVFVDVYPLGDRPPLPLPGA